MDAGNSQTSLASVILPLFFGSIILAGIMGVVFLQSKTAQRQNTSTVAPSEAASASSSVSSIPRFTASPGAVWKQFTGTVYPYTFSYPEPLELVVFPNDPSDSVAIIWANIPAQQNILINIELIEKRDPALVTQPKIEYVRNWYKFFPGLKNVASVEAFTTTHGMKGYTAKYINLAGDTPNTDVFFEIPGRNDIMIHAANGVLEDTLFTRILDTVRWSLPVSSPTPAP